MDQKIILWGLILAPSLLIMGVVFEQISLSSAEKKLLHYGEFLDLRLEKVRRARG